MIGDLFRTTGPFAPPPPSGAQPPPLWGSEEHLAELFGDRVSFPTQRRENLGINAFTKARDYGEHSKAYYGPTIAVRANAERNGRAEEFDSALDAFCRRWDRGKDGVALFEKECLLSVGVRRWELALAPAPEAVEALVSPAGPLRIAGCCSKRR